MTTLLFTGYSRTHFACFQPLYQRLRERAGVDVFLSGGLRAGENDVITYDATGMYQPFDVPAEAILTVEEISELDVDVLFCANTKAIRPRSQALSVQIFHGVSFRNRAVRGENGGYDRFLMIGPYMHRRFVTADVLEADDPRALQVGFPKTDRLLDGSLERSAVLAEHGLSGERPVVLYAPTGAVANSLETIGEDLLIRLAAEDRYDVLIKPHDHPKNQIDWFTRLAPLENAHMRVVRDADVIPLLLIADLLITDASSVANEYTLLDRPIVFLDVPELLAAASAEDARIDLETWGRKGGEVAPTVERAVAAVDQAIADPSRHSEVRQAIASDLFYNHGRATDAALELLGLELSCC